MALHYSRDDYTFSADAASLSIEPGPKPIKLSRSELEQLGLAIRDDYQVPVDTKSDSNGVIDRIISALQEAIRRCRGPEESWMATDLKRAMTLIGGLDEKAAQEILDQEDV